MNWLIPLVEVAVSVPGLAVLYLLLRRAPLARDVSPAPDPPEIQYGAHYSIY